MGSLEVASVSSTSCSSSSNTCGKYDSSAQHLANSSAWTPKL